MITLLAVAPIVIGAIALVGILAGVGITLFASLESQKSPEDSLPGRQIRNLLVGGAAGIITGAFLFTRRKKG